MIASQENKQDDCHAPDVTGVSVVRVLGPGFDNFGCKIDRSPTISFQHRVVVNQLGKTEIGYL